MEKLRSIWFLIIFIENQKVINILHLSWYLLMEFHNLNIKQSILVLLKPKTFHNGFNK
jgi:predicted nuclease of restriction endonuclease-like (RecB) superfamily